MPRLEESRSPGEPSSCDSCGGSVEKYKIDQLLFLSLGQIFWQERLIRDNLLHDLWCIFQMAVYDSVECFYKDNKKSFKNNFKK